MPVSNSCQCDAPPGGGGSCAPNQLSICRSDGTHCYHECVDCRPATALLFSLIQAKSTRVRVGTLSYRRNRTAGEELVASLATAITKAHPPRSLEASVTLLLAGRYQDPLDSQNMVTFALPNHVRKTLKALVTYNGRASPRRR